MILRLIADDLTGALDTAAAFAGLVGPVTTSWPDAAYTASGNLAIDIGTREVTRAEAVAAATRAAPLLAGAGIAFKKVDSLLRGHPVAELAACLSTGAWPFCVLAPAFPYHGRVTRGGAQHARDQDGDWARVGAHMLEALHDEGIQGWQHGGALRPGVTVFDADTDAHLLAAVAAGMAAPGPVLWCGSGGLAHALTCAAPPPPTAPLPSPLLGLFGSDQAATAAQLAACGPCWLALPDAGPQNVARVRAMLAERGAALVSVVLPAGTPRVQAAAAIAAMMDGLVASLPAPGTIIAAGGETLRSLCRSLGAQGLSAQGLLQPGLPLSIFQGGRWPGVAVVSKSGAFGPPDLLAGLLSRNSP